MLTLVKEFLRQVVSGNPAATTVLNGKGSLGHLPPVSFLPDQAGLMDSDIVKEDRILDRLLGSACWPPGPTEGS